VTRSVRNELDTTEITVIGQRIVVDDRGSGGTPIVTIANVMDDGATWPAAWEPLLNSAGYRAVALHHRGTTDTVEGMADDFAAAIRGLGLDPALVVGYSQGAWITQALAHAHPDVVRGAVLLATTASPSRFVRLHWSALQEVERAVQAPAAKQALLLLTLLTPAELADDDLVEFVVAATTDGLAAITPEATERTLRSLHACLDYVENSAGRLGSLRDVTVPCLVLSFEHDILCPPSHGRAVADAIPDASYVVVPGAGHAGAMSHADEVVDRITTFFASLQ